MKKAFKTNKFLLIEKSFPKNMPKNINPAYEKFRNISVIKQPLNPPPIKDISGKYVVTNFVEKTSPLLSTIKPGKASYIDVKKVLLKSSNRFW